MILTNSLSIRRFHTCFCLHAKSEMSTPKRKKKNDQEHVPSKKAKEEFNEVLFKHLIRDPGSTFTGKSNDYEVLCSTLFCVCTPHVTGVIL